MIITPAQRQELCPAVFGSHDMWYPTEPTRLVFKDAPPYELLRREFEGVCRRCNWVDIKSERVSGVAQVHRNNPFESGSLVKPGSSNNDINLACSSVVEPRPVKPVVEGSNPSAPAIHLANGSVIELFKDVPAVCEPYDNGFAPEIFQWESPGSDFVPDPEPPCGEDCKLCGEW